jgi:hypothetical protein
MAYRMAGFFGNPNEAGFAAAAALALVLGLPYRSRILNLVATILCAVAIALTFSKTALIVGIVIVAIATLRFLRGPALLLTPIIALMIIQTVQQPREVFDTLANQTVVELSADQKRRLREVGYVLSGDLTDAATTGRTVVWGIGVERIMEALPAGYGLGSFHFLQGGVYARGGASERAHWHGVHNAFLMYFGEGGFIVGLLFISFFAALIVKAAMGASLRFEWLWIAVLLAASMSTHGVLALRFVNLMIGVLIGVLSLPNQRAKYGFQRELAPIRRDRHTPRREEDRNHRTNYLQPGNAVRHRPSKREA